MPKTDAYEAELLAAFDQGAMKSVATQAELAQLRTAARATVGKDKRVNRQISRKARVAAHRRPSAE
jgi:hypothetical protein